MPGNVGTQKLPIVGYFATTLRLQRNIVGKKQITDKRKRFLTAKSPLHVLKTWWTLAQSQMNEISWLMLPAVAFSSLPAYSHGFTERILNKTLSCVRQCAIFENKRENFLGSLSFKSGAYKLPISYNFTTIYKREYLRNETSYRETGKAFSKLQWSPTFFWNLVNFGLQSAEIFLIHSHNCHTSPNASQSSFDTCSDLWEIWICTSKIGGLWGPKLPIFR